MKIEVGKVYWCCGRAVKIIHRYFSRNRSEWLYVGIADSLGAAGQWDRIGNYIDKNCVDLWGTLTGEGEESEEEKSAGEDLKCYFERSSIVFNIEERLSLLEENLDTATGECISFDSYKDIKDIGKRLEAIEKRFEEFDYKLNHIKCTINSIHLDRRIDDTLNWLHRYKHEKPIPKKD